MLSSIGYRVTIIEWLTDTTYHSIQWLIPFYRMVMIDLSEAPFCRMADLRHRSVLFFFFSFFLLVQYATSTPSSVY